MKRIGTLAFILLGTLTPAFSQKLMLTGGYVRVGEKSFTGAPTSGLHTIFPVGKHGISGVTIQAARNRQPFQEIISRPPGENDRVITEYNNSLYSLQGFLAGRLMVAPHLEATLGPSAGLYLLGAKERTDELRLGLGLWSGLTYKQLGGGRFNLEALFHPRALLPNVPVEDANFRFDGQWLFVWDAQLGISYDLKRQP
ncbi:hypothetical protein [uncultured Hymenobacter sp.]|uniref:hypothetical protein n=1 Tax=uncultured Hymenobacter sp. TaxID=170016 RepID=UPI0035C96440